MKIVVQNSLSLKDVIRVGTIKDDMSRCDEQVVTGSKEIVATTYRVVATGKSLRALKKSLRVVVTSKSLWALKKSLR
ncbi:hypothetical protein Taro_008598 [Colocasia esculenta]|uniref:Uncharacterized protein n=1 Tax=Colocasia esculenta TaxID=4460 RepID=A0A843TYP1_COLES|nr:hypothetical protein [Colocasia esculenta]